MTSIFPSNFVRGLVMVACVATFTQTPIALAQQTETKSIQLSAQPLNEALIQIGRRFGVVVVAPDVLTAGMTATELSGTMTAEKAIETLLQGLGLTIERTRDGAFVIVEKRLSEKLSIEEVTITAYGRQHNESLKDIPQSISIIDRESFEIGLFNSVGDAMRIVPNATRAGSSLDMFADDYLVRGFDAEQSTNGLGFTQTDHPTDLVNVERIEILKGPASVLYGQMEPGGTINVVTKQPLADFQAEIGLEYGSYHQQRSTLDVTGPLSDNIRARLNIAYQEGDAPVDFLEGRRLFIAPNITMDLSDKTSITVEGSYSSNEWTALHGGAPAEGAIISNPNGDYDKSFNPAWKDSKTERDSQNINIRLTHAVTDDINARISYTYLRNEADWLEHAPFGLDDSDLRTLDRIAFVGNDTYKKDHDLILDLSGEMTVGSTIHKFIAGINYRESEVYRPTQVHFIDSVDLYNPQYGASDLSGAGLARDRTLYQDDDLLSVFVQDRITVTDGWHLLAGLRYTDSDQSQETVNHLNNNSTVKDTLKQSDWVTQLGAVYDLTEATSLYVSRSDSFVPQQGTTSGKKPLAAEESTQYEMGIRFDIGNLQASASAFVITKDNIAIEDPLNDDFEVAKGSARSKGLELSVGGYVNMNWYLNAAYGYTDTEILKSDDAELEGNEFSNIPSHTAALQTRYTLESIEGLSIGGTVSYTGDRFGNDENGFTLPSHTRVDLAAYYTVSDALQVSLLINNALDEEVFSPGSFSGVVREPERTYQARVNYSF